MTYTVNHRYVDQDLTPSVTKQGDHAIVHCSASGTLPIRFPGRIVVFAQSTYFLRLGTEDTDVDDGPHAGGSGLSHGGMSVARKFVPITVKITTPDGQPFTSDHVTLDDLGRFRDLRGTTQGAWSFTVHGQTDPIEVESGQSEVAIDGGRLTIAIDETVTSKSAPPLVNDSLGAGEHRTYRFDLYRVGTFVATAEPRSLLQSPTAHRTMTLFDPDGAQVKTSDIGRLTFPVTLEALDKSRDAQGKPRRWSLEVFPFDSPSVHTRTTILANVIATARIHTQTLKSRIDDLIGVGGSKLRIFGEIDPVHARLLVRLVVVDEASAETIDMWHLLRSRLRKVTQDPDVDPNEFKANVRYSLANRSRDLSSDLHVSLNGVKIDRIDIAIGASEQIQPPIPAVKIDLQVEGDATVRFGGFPIATASVTDNRIHMEAGVRRHADGSFSAETWINNVVLSVDLHWAAAVAAGIVSFGILSFLGEAGVKVFIESELNDRIVQGLRDVVGGVMSEVPRILAILLGDDFTYRSMRLDGDDIVFDYVAPLEPDPKPFQNYLGIIGRRAVQLTPEVWKITPQSLGDTWSTQNLSKIDHIVMVMMENRSFDHVLGYRAQLSGVTNSDGLTAELAQFLQSQALPVPAMLRQSAIVPNALGFKTRFPSSVGHHLADVIQQMGVRITEPSGRAINSPQGFLDNFTKYVGAPLSVNDVLGFYTGDDLPFTHHLAENYAYCERFFSSHAGPTLPNRMYWLAGDVQYDRTGEAILDNNNSENFAFSRAMTIFDLLTKKRIGWRVYESQPSVAMLRMFARYATDDAHIVDIARFVQDVALGDLPAVTAIEPAMHHAPENDDHPVADMYNGQLFLKHVYDTLRSNDALWRKTMLVIAYDEHGGFYDHVVPPMAEVRMRPMESTDGGPAVPPFTASTLVTHYGLRVPAFVVSPWTPAGKGPDVVLDHCSIVKTILARFCPSRPFVSDRVNASRSLDAYLSAPAPRTDVLPSPALAALPHSMPGGRRPIATPPVTSRKMDSGQVDFHELGGMVARWLGR